MIDELDGRADARLVEIGQRLGGAASELGDRHPAVADRVRTALEALDERLARAHARCDEVDDRDWATYLAGLDLGLDELALEVARAAELPEAASVDDAVFAQTVRLELDAWVLRLDVAGRDAPADGRGLVAAVAAELADFRAAAQDGAAASRAGVEQAMDELRRTLP